MSFKEVFILIPISIEDVDIYASMYPTHLTIRAELPINQFYIWLIFSITSYPNQIIIS